MQYHHFLNIEPFSVQFILQLEKALRQNVHVLLLKQHLYNYKQVSLQKTIGK